MTNAADKIGELAASVIILMIVGTVVATLAGANPDSFSGFLTTGVRLVVIVAVIGVFGALVVSVISGDGR